jgi:hypothetical protein
VVGFAPEGVIEYRTDPSFSISLLFSASRDRASMVRSTVQIVTLARLLQLDFTPWLSRQLQRRGLDAEWRTLHRIGDARVTAEHLGRGAVLLTVDGPGRRP